MSSTTPQVLEWQIFNPVPNAQAIADGLGDIPAHWSLTPLQDKAPKRDGWECEAFLPHSTIASLILKGERKTSKKSGKQYTAYYSGAGLRTGEQSGGLAAIDVDGASAEPLLQRMSGGDLPLTPEWTSGKPGRKQIVFQVPDEIRPLVADFGRAVVTEFEESKTADGEMLEFRYSNHQSCLPPSRHPQTGAYKWINSPAVVPVAIAPPWLCTKLVEFANLERQDSERKHQQSEERERQALERRQQRQLNTIGVTTLEDVLEESLKRLHVEDIYNWSGHNWHYQGKSLLGCCPQHQSASGKSFHVNTEALTWYCFNCRVGGGPVAYRYFVVGGNGSPRGRDFVEVLRELAADAGVQMPDLPKPERDRRWDEPEPDAYTQYTQQQEEQNRADECAAAFDEDRRRREWGEQLRYELNPPTEAYVWGQRYPEAPSPRTLWELGYKPTRTVHERYLNLAGIDTSFLCLISAMNTGKTQALAQLTSNPDDSLLIVANTVALVEAMAARYNCRCYNEADIDLGQVHRLVITADSLWKVPTFNKRFKYFVMDEADQVTSHLASGDTCRRNRERILAVFSYFAATAEHYILADADLSGPVIDWHSQLRNEPPYILQNTYQPYEGRIAYQFSCQEAAFEYACQLLEEGKRVVISTDSKATVKKTGASLSGVNTIEGIENLDAEAIGESLATRFPDKKGRIIHGDNSGKPDVRNFIKNINSSLKYIPLDFLVYNSSMQSGVSIDFEAFDEVIGIYTGYTLPHTELAQLPHRYRPDVPFSFYVNPDGRTGLETNCYKIAGDFLYKNRASGLSLRIDPHTGMLGIDNSEFLQLVASLETRRNWSLMNIAATFTTHLEGMAYQVIPHPDEYLLTGLDAVKEELKERRRIVGAAEVATICKTQLLAPSQYESLKNKPNPDFYERCSLQKFELHEFYGVEVTEELIEKDDGGQLRRNLTRLDLLLNPETTARRMDLSDRRKHHVVTDLKHYKLQRDLLSDLELLEFIDPEKEYHSHDLTTLGERARARTLDIKRTLGITISVAPRYLRDGRIVAQRGIKALFKPATDLATKWLLLNLTSGTASSLQDKQFKNQQQADEYCSQLSAIAKLICEAVAVGKRFKALEATHSQIHAALCNVVGVKREQTRQTREGRFYRITPDSWKFASEVLVHRNRQRDQRFFDREKELELEAQRFQNLSTAEMQSKIESEIQNASKVDAPTLVFLAEQWIKFAADQEQPDAPSHPRRLYSIYDFSGGGVTKSQRVTPDAEVRLSESVIPYCRIPDLPNQPLSVEQLATGRTDSHEFYDYLKIKTQDGEGYWLPAEWLESLDKLPVRRDPDAYTPRIPAATLRTWRYWLLGVRSLAEFEQFERRRKPKDLQTVVDSLAPDQLKATQQRLLDWGVSRDWLPQMAVEDARLVQDIKDWLEATVELGDDEAPQAVADAVESIRVQDWFEAARRHIWNYLSDQLKAAIARLSPASYQILAGVQL